MPEHVSYEDVYMTDFVIVGLNISLLSKISPVFLARARAGAFVRLDTPQCY